MAEEAKRSGGVMQRLVLWLVVLGLLAAVWYLASERNQRHFRVAAENGQLVIERGRFFPLGTAPSADKTYAPIPVPQGEKPPAELEFDDQNALDQHLFGLLAGWAKDAQKKGDTKTAATLADRASALPGLTGAQFGELSAMKADLAWAEALTAVQQAADLLDGAMRSLQIVAASKGEHAVEATREADRLHGVSELLRAVPKPPSPQPPQQQPPQQPQQQPGPQGAQK